mmetsp:Transcript_6096/g.25544  ORF Transcript_6096/g.25544 Transcript_6096/m.25544 type:complete len:247 (-) Transcript_6096:532-1272(-)
MLGGHHRKTTATAPSSQTQKATASAFSRRTVAPVSSWMRSLEVPLCEVIQTASYAPRRGARKSVTKRRTRGAMTSLSSSSPASAALTWSVGCVGYPAGSTHDASTRAPYARSISARLRRRHAASSYGVSPMRSCAMTTAAASSESASTPPRGDRLLREEDDARSCVSRARRNGDETRRTRRVNFVPPLCEEVVSLRYNDATSSPPLVVVVVAPLEESSTWLATKAAMSSPAFWACTRPTGVRSSSK